MESVRDFLIQTVNGNGNAFCFTPSKKNEKINKKTLQHEQ